MSETSLPLLPPDSSALGESSQEIALAIERANQLIQSNQLDEARQLYAAILSRDPNNVVALNNTGVLLNQLGHISTALQMFRALVALHPDNIGLRLNLAHRLRESSELKEARGEYETVLRELPDSPEAHWGLAHVLMYLGETASAWEHEKKAPSLRPLLHFPNKAKAGVRRILLLSSPCGGNAPVRRLLRNEFEMLVIVPDFLSSSADLPPHDLIFNGVGDAELCQTSLDGAERVVNRSAATILNQPARIRATDRVGNSRVLGGLESVVAPRMEIFPREVLAGADGVSALEQRGFGFPLLLRAPTFHGGSHFLRVEDESGLHPAVAELPGPNLLAIEYLDARDADGKVRKYRVMMVDGKLYPLHKAVSQDWKIHYFSADMVNNAEHRAEDEAFLEDMPGVLGPRAMGALQRICDTMGLDYAGADFSIGAQGEVLIFEANATMVTPAASKGAQWDYRREPVRRIHDAVRAMVRQRAAK